MDEVQKLAVRLVGRNGRRRFDQSSKDRLVAACLEPGATVSKLAREHGVNANLVGEAVTEQLHIEVKAKVLQNVRTGINTPVVIAPMPTQPMPGSIATAASAIIYSLMLTCRACGIEPLTWLRHVLTQLPQRADNAAITELLPFNFAKIAAA